MPRQARMGLVIVAALLGGLLVLALGVWGLAPREPGRFDPPPVDILADDLDAHLAQAEAGVPGVRPEAARRIVWAGRPGERTAWALVYLHGFSATHQELHPVPELVAAWSGANLYLSRLPGHGQDGAAMAGPRVADWAREVAEAVAIGHRLGERVVLIGTSTGGTLAALAAQSAALGDRIDAVVLVSPNFGLRHEQAWLLDLPGARQWLPLLGGRTRCFQPQSDRHAAAWTTCYPTAALMPMAALVNEAAGTDFSGARQPMLLIHDEADAVVDAAASARVAAEWGGPVTRHHPSPGPGDDPSRHVIAGDILSPSQTVPVARAISNWMGDLQRR